MRKLDLKKIKGVEIIHMGYFFLPIYRIALGQIKLGPVLQNIYI